ncbi:uncharacterized protein G2W53_016443 [Senna tora]|uniref:Retrotransposon Copia-like N-terminal domain-containing protein n=1 Tax=Senna tora TaxID=362788 RepID=A0A834TPF0_9FABA|nr:uncharacterized protein G2W53_016443 [Senna tora]
MADEQAVKMKAAKGDEGPYQLHSSDHPGMSLVTTTLNGSNYLAWSIAVITALEAKDKTGFIDGYVLPPEDQVEYRKWKKERFGVNNAPQLYQVQKKTASIQQGQDSVTLYYNKINRLWDEISRLMPMPNCSCGKCTCGLKKKIGDLDASTKLIQFLMGLSSVYDVIRSQILSLDLLPSVNKAFSMVLRDETQRQINMSNSNGVDGGSALLARSYQGKNEPGGFKKKEVSKKDKYCDHCKVNGHTKDTCFKIHGYPDWFKELREKRANAGKKPMANMANDAIAETPIGQDSDQGSKNDLENVVSYLLKEVQRLGKGKPIDGKVTKSTLPTFMIFQDQRSKQILAKGAAIGNLYYLNASSFTFNTGTCKEQCNMRCNTVATLNNRDLLTAKLWHSRLGHPSVQVLKHINEIPVFDFSTEPCEICHASKQHRLPFASSNTKAEKREVVRQGVLPSISVTVDNNDDEGDLSEPSEDGDNPYLNPEPNPPQIVNPLGTEPPVGNLTQPLEVVPFGGTRTSLRTKKAPSWLEDYLVYCIRSSVVSGGLLDIVFGLVCIGPSL